MNCYCDYEPPSVFRSNRQRARKPYRCSECGCDIEVGETYKYNWGVWDGRPDTFRWCQLCDELHQWCIISSDCFCWQYGNMLQDARDLATEIAYAEKGLWMEFGRRYIPIRRRMRERWKRKREGFDAAGTVSDEGG